MRVRRRDLPPVEKVETPAPMPEQIDVDAVLTPVIEAMNKQAAGLRDMILRKGPPPKYEFTIVRDADGLIKKITASPVLMN